MSENCEPEILRIGAAVISFAQHLIATFAQHTIAYGDRKAPVLGLRPDFRLNPIDPRSAQCGYALTSPSKSQRTPKTSRSQAPTPPTMDQMRSAFAPRVL